MEHEDTDLAAGHRSNGRDSARTKKEGERKVSDLERVKQTAETHWDTYVKKVLETHGEDADVVRKCGFHYVSAFVHGYKHGWEDRE